MECEFGYVDCINIDQKCHLCMKELHYVPVKRKNIGLNKSIKVKESKRQGSMNEVKTYNQIKDSVEGTPNSGAGSIKGDLQIGKMAMIECKTTTKKNEGRQPGKESFSIQRSHLEKLKKESKEAGKEFCFLVFSFKEHDNDLYGIADLEVFNSMIATMKHDRSELTKTNNLIDIHKTKSTLIEAENTKYIAEINHLKAKLKYYKEKDKELFL